MVIYPNDSRSVVDPGGWTRSTNSSNPPPRLTIREQLEQKSTSKEDADSKTRLYLEYVIGLTAEEVEEIADKIKSFYEGAEI